jgi:excisionase family DNA binding protein
VSRHVRDPDDLRLRGAGELTIGEAARALGVHKNAIRRWPPDELPFHEIGPRRDRRYSAEIVSAYIEARSRGSAPGDELRTGGRLERVLADQQITRTLATATRQAANAGDDTLARQLRQARSLISERLDLSDR